MALSLPTNFKSDIQSRDTSLVPVVIISTNPAIRVSTNSINFDGYNYSPILSNIPSLKESVDVENRTYKISNVTLDISNLPYGGERFSEIAGDSSLINTSVDIFWISPSSKKIQSIGDLNGDGVIDGGYSPVTWGDFKLFLDCLGEGNCEELYGDLTDIDRSNFSNTEDFQIFSDALQKHGGSLPPGYFGYTDTSPESAMHIYHGKIRRYVHDDEKVKITLEDRTQSVLHIDFPNSYLPATSEVPDKYKNKPIPMVFGYVDKSPCVIESVDDLTGEYTVGAGDFIDLMDISYNTNPTYYISNDSNNLAYLQIFKDDQYLIVPQSVEISGLGVASISSAHWNPPSLNNSLNILDKYSYNNPIQYALLGSSKITFTNNTSNLAPLTNTISENNVLVYFRSEIENIKIFKESDNFEYTAPSGKLYSYNYPPHGSDSPGEPGIFYYVVKGIFRYNEEEDGNNDNDYDFWVYHDNHKISYKLILPTANAAFQDAGEAWFAQTFIKGNGKIINKQNWYWDVIPLGTYVGYSHDPLEGNYAVGEQSGIYYPGVGTESTFDSDSIFNFEGHYLGSWVDNPKPNHSIEAWTTAGYAPNHTVSASVYLNISEFYVEHFFITEDFIESDFYAKVVGNGITGFLGDFPKANEVIKDIVSHIDNYFSHSVLTPNDEYDEWKYQFTINSKINSKKLIEEISSISPYIAHFTNKGDFEFDVIMKNYSNENVIDPNGVNGENASENHIIKEDDVIDFSFNRTKVENVYTKIELKYNWDYGAGKFSDNFITSIDHDSNQFNYYGFTTPVQNEDGSWDHSESTLIIDDNRGKYIRDHTTAENITTWLLNWYKNQHLKIKIKLPLKYMNISVGDIIEFDAILGDVKPFNIDYAYEETISHTLNGQLYFKKFMIISTNKTLEYCKIECVQMHDLSDVIYGCTNATACNYNENATELSECIFDYDYPPLFQDIDGDGLGSGDPAYFCPGESTLVNGIQYVNNSSDSCPYDTGNVITDCFGNCPSSDTDVPNLSYIGEADNYGLDECGVCGGDNLSCTDECGVINGDNSTCSDCAGVPNGDAVVDECGNCGGDNSSCVDCAGIPYGNAIIDVCGNCTGGDNYEEDACDECVETLDTPCMEPGGSYPDDCYAPDNCGVCGGNNECTTWVLDSVRLGIFKQHTTDITEDFLNPIIDEALEEGGSYPISYSDYTEYYDFGKKYVIMPILKETLDQECLGNEEIMLSVSLFDNDTGTLIESWESGTGWYIQAGNVMQDMQYLTTSPLYWEGPFNCEENNGDQLLPFPFGIMGEWMGNHDNFDQEDTQPSIIDPYGDGSPINNINYRLEITAYDENLNPLFHPDPDNPTDNNKRIIHFSLGTFDTGIYHVGDINNDGIYNVLDIVGLANCVLSQTCGTLYNSCAADLNGDGIYNVLDIVNLANCVLAQNCGEEDCS